MSSTTNSNGTDRTKPAEDDQRPGIGRILLRAVCVALAAACASILLEAITIFGSPIHHVFDLASWSRRRLVVFFAIAIVAIIATLVIRKRRLASERHKPKRQIAASMARPVPSAIATIAAIALGMLLGTLVAQGMGHPADPRYGIVISCALIVAALLVINADLILKAAEWGFLAIAIPVTMCMCLIMPTAAEVSWDGQIHFDNANALSYITSADYSGADQFMTVGGVETGCLTITDGRRGDGTITLDHEYLERSNDNLRRADQEIPVKEARGTAGYGTFTWVGRSAPGWIPNAFGLWLGRALHLDCVARYTLSRMCNALFFCFVSFLAIGRLKRGKLIASAISLFPIGLFMAANFSYDPWVNCLVAYAFCHFAGKLQAKERMTATDGAVIALTFFAGALVKAVVFPLALAFFVVPKDRFESRRTRIIYNLWIVGSIFGLLASFALPFVINLMAGAKMGDMRGGSNVNSGSQVGFILSHPAKASGIVASHMITMLRPDNLSRALFYSDAYLHPSEFWGFIVIGWVEYALLLFVSLFDRDERDVVFGPIHKVAGILCPLVTFLLITLALYIDYNPVGSEGIDGVQYRYLIPLAPCFCLLTLNFKRLRSLIPEQVTSSVFHVVVAIATVAPIFLSFVTQF